MAEISEASTTSSAELVAEGRRHLAVKDFSAAAETLAKACETLAEEFGDMGDQCGEAYLWYGKALLGLSREESGVLGDGVPGTGNGEEEEEDEDENEQQEENGENETAEQNGEAGSSEEAKKNEEVKKNGEAKKNGKPSNQDAKKNGESSSTAVEKNEAESTTEEPGSSSVGGDGPSTSNGDAADESMVDADADEVDNLQLAWEMLDLSRSILERRAAGAVGAAGGAAGGAASGAARALLADTHLALGEVALESETYDKAVIDLQSCLEIQKDLYGSDDRRIAETHYQIGLANSLASNFEDAITHFKNAANILESRIKTLENPAAKEDATVKKYSTTDPGYTIEGEIKELKELLPEIQEKIQDMMDYKAETIKRLRKSLCGSTKGEGSSSSQTLSSSSSAQSTNQAKPAASDISHLIKRKRKASDSTPEATDAKRVNT